VYDLFIFCHNLITWLIPKQCHILNDAVACSWSAGMIEKSGRAGSGRERGESLEQADDVATVLHCHVVMAPIS